MKAKLRREQRERMKASMSIFQNSISENKSQDNNSNHPEIKRKKDRNRSAEIKPGLFPGENIKNANKKLSLKPFKSNPMNIINKEELKEQELSRIATMFNFKVDKEKDIVKIQENDEYYDMRNQITQLQNELDNEKEKYENLVIKYEEKNEAEKKKILELENELKLRLDNDVEKIKKDNIILTRDINLLDKKYDSLNALYKKELYDINEVSLELDNVIRKLRGEINFIDDLKMRLKNLTNKDISQELVDSINYVFKDNINPQNKNTSHSNIGSVRSRTGTIPIADILDNSLLDSKKSIKKLYI